ncbi:MAG: hypothetical protein HN494_15735 [Opitutae bacterium]|nr:hypothetical protein [Opitutae bacterium]
MIQTLHDCISFRASAGARALAVRQADCVCPESFPRRTAAVGSAEVLAQESIRSQFKKFRFKHHMTASLTERPPGRVHWPYGKPIGFVLNRFPDGLPPWAPPKCSHRKASDHNSRNLGSNTT